MKILLLLCFAFTSTAFPQQWVQQTFNYSDSDVTGICFINTNIGFLLLGNEVQKTIDGGVTFNTIYSFEGNLNHITYSGSTLFIAGTKFLRSTDQGNTFTVFNWTFNPANMFFLDDHTGWIVNSGIYKTIDGGNTWQNQYIPFAPFDVVFIDSDNGFVTPDAYPFTWYAKTTNGGASWMLVNIGDTISGMDIFFYDSLRGQVGEWYTSDAGNTWTGGKPYGFKFSCKNGTAIAYRQSWWNYNYYSNVYKEFFITYDYGVTWDTLHRATGERYVFMEIIDSSSFIYGELKGAVYKTTDKGKNWYCLTHPSSRLEGGYFLNDLTGWVTGEGNLLKTTDGGNSWTFIHTGLEHLSRIYFLSEMKGFGLYRKELGQGYNLVTVYRTEDGGMNWIELFQIKNGIGWHFWNKGELLFYDSLFGYGVTPTSYFFTNDGGDTWTIDTTSGTGGFDIHFSDRNTGFIGGKGSYGYKTTDGGETWTQKAALGWSNSVFFIDNLTGWKSANWLVWKTTDGGNSFFEVMNHGQEHEFTELNFFDAYNGIVTDISSIKGIYKTADGGFSWQGITGDHNLCYFRNPNLGWAFGLDGLIFRYGEIVPVELLSFSAGVDGPNVMLSWATASETNNLGFELVRRSRTGNDIKTEFIPGAGTTTDVRAYSFTDVLTDPGTYYYKLVQLDYDGKKTPLSEIEVTAGPVYSFNLAQNYPNPFNPNTVISYQLPASSKVTLKVYDVLGNEVITLVNSEKASGSYEVEFNAAGSPSGVFLYQLKAGPFIETKKMILMK